jgi:hypothetical protein
LLANSEGVALIGLGGINLDCLKAFSKFNPNFLVLPDPISFLLSELLLSLRHFLDLWESSYIRRAKQDDVYGVSNIIHLENRAQEQVANTAQRQNACRNLEYRAQAEVVNTAQRKLAKE